MWHALWTTIDRFLTSSGPQDGWVYTAKYWTLTHVTEPVLELAYAQGIRSYKPISRCNANDLI